ncbi:50S ribosomal protein L24 [Candidatus Anstonella stagnisolia]|nr:50S ribosomal protein L24 [Candidatus Anstonella stagnisolia]
MMTTSAQPRKQRKFRYEAPMHLRRKFVHVHISKELRAKLGLIARSTLVHKGDKVKIRTGEKKKHVGNVTRVDYSRSRLYVEGVVAKNAKGVEKPMAVQPSNVEIIEGDFTKGIRAKMPRKK